MASENQQQRHDQDEDLDSMYSDDVQFVYLVPGTTEEQNAAREACDDGDNDSDLSGSVATGVQSVFDVALEPQTSESNLGIARQWRTGFVLGGDVSWNNWNPTFPAPTSSGLASDLDQIAIFAAPDPAEDGDGNPDSKPEVGSENDPDPPSNPASSSEQVASQTQSPPDHPAFLVDWVRAPRDYQIEDMPGFLHFDIQNGRRVAIFDERTWKEGFTRGLRKHIMRRARRDDDPNE